MNTRVLQLLTSPSHPKGKLNRRSIGITFVMAALCAANSQAATYTEKVLHSFGVLSTGYGPQGPLLRDHAGHLYGATYSGGRYGFGVVFKVDSTGRQSVLYNFMGGSDGANPNAGLIADLAGNLYGTTSIGGTSGAGVVYKLDSAGHETVLHSFTGGADGGGPLGLVSDASGNLYGAAGYGGADNFGVVYKLDTAGNETVLHSFQSTDGKTPAAPLILDQEGNLYGTTIKGGADNFGTVFKIDASGTETVLHSFDINDGRDPASPVLLDASGNLYGVTSAGGLHADAGTVFKISPSGQFTSLYSFPNAAEGHPFGGLAFDLTGNLYGTTEGGYPTYSGLVFKLTPSGQETTLHTFTGGNDGANAVGGVIFDKAGNLYGCTVGGGPANEGTIYKLNPSGQESILFAFPGAPDGSLPLAGVIADAAGNLYGTTEDGGAFNAGTVYTVDPSGKLSVLYNFMGGADATFPTAPLTRDPAGNLYGATTNGGANNFGTVFKVDSSGRETVLYSFHLGADGGYPNAGVVLDPDGNLYGTASEGGLFDAGVVFKVDPAGNETVLYAFQGSGDGFIPYGGVIRDSSGNLYGVAGSNGGVATAQGVVYKLDPTGNQTVLYTFTGGADGGGPRSSLVRDPAGDLYGTTSYGGSANNGVVFKVDPSGHETVLHAFKGGADGGAPTNGLVLRPSGNLYGFVSGLLYQVDASGAETILYTFPGGAGGGLPNGVPLITPNGAILGTTSNGGTAGSGVLFTLIP